MEFSYTFTKDGDYCERKEVKTSVDVQIHSGQCGALGPVLVRLSEARLIDIAATVYSESHENIDEAEGIARVLRNRAEIKFPNIENPLGTVDAKTLWSKIGESGIYGRKGESFAAVSKYSNLDGWLNSFTPSKAERKWISQKKMLTILRGTVRAFASSGDGGSRDTYWEATGRLEKPTHDWRKDKWVGGNDKHYKHWLPESLDPKILRDALYDPGLMWTRNIGGTSFFKVNHANCLVARQEYPLHFYDKCPSTKDNGHH